jgi:hypothetical protein
VADKQAKRGTHDGLLLRNVRQVHCDSRSLSELETP